MDKALRDHVIALLSGNGAHISFDDAVDGFPVELAGKRIPDLAHTAWMLVYHIWIAQKEIVGFTLSPDYLQLEYPHGYWPSSDAPPSQEEWNSTVREIREDLDRMISLVQNPGKDLFSVIPHGSGQTILREALVLADHNSYHVAQLVDIRMLLGVPVKDW